MQTRLMDLVVLVAEMRREREHSSGDLDERLVSLGYTSAEIEEAIVCFASLGDTSDDASPSEPVDAHASGSLRVLSEFERMSVSAESYGFLLRLLNLNIITLDQFEQIVGRAIPVGPEKITLGDVKDIACAVVFGRESEEVGDFGLDAFMEEEPTA